MKNMNKLMVHFLSYDGRQAVSGPYLRVTFHVDHILVAEEGKTLEGFEDWQIAQQVPGGLWLFENASYNTAIVKALSE